MTRQAYSIDLIRQMAECDANYIRLLQLMPILRVYRKAQLAGIAIEQQNDSATAPLQPDDLSQADQNANQILGDVTEFIVADYANGDQRASVEIRIVESFKYTTTLEIRQKPSPEEYMTNPAMTVRVYHDASTAEVTSYQGHSNLKPIYPQPNPRMYQRDEKMQINRFLGEWLSLCLKAGRSMKVPDLLFSN